AIVRMIKEMKRGRRCGGVVPDGPQGPRHIVQPGVVYLAQKTGYPIIPVTYSAQRRILLNSWDRFLIPHPGTDCLMIYGRPLQVPAQLDEVRLNQHTKILETELMRITQEADRFYGHRLE
ncbi:MAG: hypothetical protein HKP58_07215, partial [Desulfatitalea sp.]|nr:hypothetical protein [Desulfatitalea sp.]